MNETNCMKNWKDSLNRQPGLDSCLSTVCLKMKFHSQQSQPFYIYSCNSKPNEWDSDVYHITTQYRYFITFISTCAHTHYALAKGQVAMMMRIWLFCLRFLRLQTFSLYTNNLLLFCRIFHVIPLNPFSIQLWIVLWICEWNWNSKYFSYYLRH